MDTYIVVENVNIYIGKEKQIKQYDTLYSSDLSEEEILKFIKKGYIKKIEDKSSQHKEDNIEEEEDNTEDEEDNTEDEEDNTEDEEDNTEDEEDNTEDEEDNTESEEDNTERYLYEHEIELLNKKELLEYGEKIGILDLDKNSKVSDLKDLIINFIETQVDIDEI
jgi:hypothetical protein